MAVKERKQITGTTEQINAYAGHEGQIVWDKDKKTLVGMSGTAGNNYPLASQTYVATQLTEGLEGKEDKGTCLPLTGGKLTGGLTVKGSVADSKVADIYTDDQTTEIMITAGDADWRKAGGALALYSKNHSAIPGGGFNLFGYSAGEPRALSFQGPDFNLRWLGEAVVTGVLKNQTIGSGGYMKFNHVSDSISGKVYSYFAIVWTDYLDFGPSEKRIVTLPIPLNVMYFSTYQARSGTTNSPAVAWSSSTSIEIINTDPVHRPLRIVAYGAM